MKRTKVWLCAAVLLVGWTITLPGAARGDGALLIDDFEDRDLEAAPGVSWIVIGDELMGGESTGRLEIVAGGGSRGALAFAGELVPGARGAFTGAWTAIGAAGAPRDLTGYTGLRFRTRGTPGRYTAGVRGAGSLGNFMAPFEVGAEWREVELPFADLRPLPPPPQEVAWSAAALAWIGVSAAAAPGAASGFRIELDDVAFVPAAAPTPRSRRPRSRTPGPSRPSPGARWSPIRPVTAPRRACPTRRRSPGRPTPRGGCGSASASTARRRRSGWASTWPSTWTAIPPTAPPGGAPTRPSTSIG